MILGILLIAVVAAAAVSITLFLMSAPPWVAVLAYPVTGTAIVFVGIALSELRRWLPDDKRTFVSRVTDRFRAGQRPR